MTRSLANLKVLVTRPEHQARELCAGIQAEGGIPLPLPLIEIRPLQAEKDRASLARRIQDLDQFDIIIFVSTNAVQQASVFIENYWPQFPVGIAVIAIGPSTAALAEQRLQCAVQQPEHGMDTEAILAMPALQAVRDRRIGIFRGKGGRELLADSLRERGARVEYLEVYSRCPRHYANDELGAYLDNPGIDVLTVTSTESLDQLLILAGHNKARLCLLPLIVPSRRVADYARQAGFQQVIDAAGASEAFFLTALRELAAGAD